MSTRRRAVVVEGLSRRGAAFSTAVIAPPGRLLFVSGLLARTDQGAIVGKGDVALQTRRICENLGRIVEAAGSTLDCIMRLDVHVTNIADRERIYAVRREFFPIDPPTSTMVQVAAFTDPDALIEITAIGVLPDPA